MEHVELIADLNKGDSTALARIYDIFADGMYTYVYNRIKDKQASEDIIQDIFVTLWVKHKRLEIDNSVESYLYGACKYKVLSYIRHSDVINRYADDFIDFILNNNDNSVEGLTNINDIWHIVEQTMLTMSPQCHRAFRMSRIEHLTNDEIAKQMAISRRTVENYITIALSMLRERLREFLLG